MVQQVLTKPRLVVVDAGDHWTQNLFSEMAVSYEVLLVKLRSPRALVSGKIDFLKGTREVSHGVHELSVQMPPRHLTTMWPLARWLITRSIRSAGFGSPDVLVLSYPYYADLIDQLDPKKSLYYVYDEYSRFWPRHEQDVLHREAALIAKADVTITVSKFNTDRLKEMHPGRADDIHHVPNGVNPQFMAGNLDGLDLPSRLAEIPTPRAGYIGSLNFRFDYPMFAEVAALRPDISFVLGGWYPKPIPDDPEWQAAYKRAKALPNVHFIGVVPFEDLARYWKGFDVFLMLYRKCLFNDVACPLKLWDYLGAGGPIVANDGNPETLLWSDYVRIGATPDALVLEIDAALTEGRARAAERVAVAQSHAWDKIAMKAMEILDGVPLPR